MSKYILETNKLTKVFGKQKAVNNVSLKIEENSVYGLLGPNGAGKSTFIDGLMALLQPASKASFNVAAAQGDRSDRSLVTYMRGSYGSEHDGSTTKVKSKREKAVTTALRALYIAEDGSQITLIGLFWLGQGKNSLSDVNRLYMIASRNVLLTEVLEIFADGNTRQLKQGRVKLEVRHKPPN